MGESAFYQHSKHVPLASRISLRVRAKMFAEFMRVFSPKANTTILDVGVTSDTDQQESNFFERFYPYPEQIVCVGTEDGSHLERSYPGLRYRQVRSGEPLPFADKQFDIAFSNAVLEHTGSRAEQARFLQEISRVSRGFFVTTPNRWFPIEHHTGLPLLHYLPPPLFRRLLRRTRFHYWTKEENLNILSANDLQRMAPKERSCRVRKIRNFGLPSNLVIYGI